MLGRISYLLPKCNPYISFNLLCKRFDTDITAHLHDLPGAATNSQDSFKVIQSLTLSLACCRGTDRFPKGLASCKDSLDLRELMDMTMKAWGPVKLATYTELEEREKLIAIELSMLERAEQELAQMVNKTADFLFTVQ